METITKWNRWANSHTNIFTDILRVLFGAFLLYKGVYFLQDTEALYGLVRGVANEGTYFILVHYVALTHICGGAFIMMGLITRWCALVEIPIFLGAILVNFIGTMHPLNLLQATLALVVSGFFVFYGSGRHSVDHSLRLHA